MTLAQVTQAVCALGIVLVVGVLLFALQGCASAPMDEPCGYMPVAQNVRQGVLYVKVYCVKEV